MRSDDFLDSFRDRLEDTIRRGQELGRGLSEGALNARPSGVAWSIGQVYDHMMVANDLYFRRAQQALPEAPKGGHAEATHTWVGKMILGGMDNPNVPAPKKMLPSVGPFDADVIERWAEQHRQILLFADRAQGCDLGAPLIRNPILPLVRMSFADWFEIVLAHADRHLGQIEARR
jgi:hypothetical protein